MVEGKKEFLSFKALIENDQIPTPIWCDDKKTVDKLFSL